MRFLLMIRSEEETIRNFEPEVAKGLTAEYMSLTDELNERGVLPGAERLLPTPEGTHVQVRDGKVLTTDGPFAETKEQIGGFYLVDCKDRDEAVEIASRLPAARMWSVEVRPIWEM